MSSPTKFQVIGAGLPRTGTMSLHAALNKLLNSPSYHMKTILTVETPQRVDFWNKAIEGKVSPDDFKDFLDGGGYTSCVDYPGSFHYKELMEAYPDAKVVLTDRSPETWAVSVKNSIMHLSDIANSFFVWIFLEFVRNTYFRQMIPNRYLNTIPKGFKHSVFSSVRSSNPQDAINFFTLWKQDIINTVPADKLLIFQVKDGWKPLCDFLDVPIPDEPFPRANDTKSMQEWANKYKKMTIITVILPMGLLALFVLWVLSNLFL